MKALMGMLIVAATLALPGCAENGISGHADGFWNTDNAGERGERRSRESVELDVRIGSVDDPGETLTEVRDLAIGPDGTIYILQHTTREVRMYAGDGEFQRVIGRSGEGPGEFRNPVRVGWMDGHLWVADAGLGRLSEFGPNGDFLGSNTYQVSPGPGSNLEIGRPDAPLRTGTFLTLPTAPASLLVDGLIEALPILRVDEGGNVLDTLALRSVRNELMRVTIPASSGQPFEAFLPQPFSNATLWVVRPQGAGVVLVHRATNSDVGREGIVTVTWIDPEGGEETVDLGYQPVPLAPDQLSSVSASLAGTLGQISFLEGRVRPENVRESLFVPAHEPPVTAVVAGHDGTTWLRHWAPPETKGGERVVWTVLDATGRVTAEVEVPVAVTILRAERSYLWGTETDAIGVPYVVRYRVVSNSLEVPGPDPLR